MKKGLHFAMSNYVSISSSTHVLLTWQFEYGFSIRRILCTYSIQWVLHSHYFIVTLSGWPDINLDLSGWPDIRYQHWPQCVISGHRTEILILKIQMCSKKLVTHMSENFGDKKGRREKRCFID